MKTHITYVLWGCPYGKLSTLVDLSGYQVRLHGMVKYFRGISIDLLGSGNGSSSLYLMKEYHNLKFEMEICH